MEYLFGLVATTLLCALWMLLQLWLKRVSPQPEQYRPGCGACQSDACLRSVSNQQD